MSEFSRRRREPNLGDDFLSQSLHVPPAQDAVVEAKQVAKVLISIPDAFTKPLLLVALGENYKDVAAVCGCEVGTVKSRVNRARAKLLSALGQNPPDPGAARRLVDA
jgi:RNA polymerase sigma-70 factor (ECF subfamily)